MASGEPAVERKGSEKDEEERKEEDLCGHAGQRHRSYVAYGGNCNITVALSRTRLCRQHYGMAALTSSISN
eukprot:scaffold6174_cov125-Isochrysis_galbana.AAC.7